MKLFMAKFNEEVCKCIVDNYSEGLSITDCADIAGVARETIHRWMKKGETARSGKYKQFYQDMLQARVKFKKYHIQKVAESKDWRASQYLLQVTDQNFIVTEKKQVEANANIKTELIKALERPLPELKEEDD